jgi:Ni2+-binding GTPase involved in maturation of urease and hydrogenase
MAKTFKKSYIPKEVDSQAKEKAKRLFIDESMVVIVGPTGSGKTSISFELLSSYDLSNGEDNFVVIADPSELKFVNLSLHPVIIIKSLCGQKFNHAEAHRWYSQLDRLYAAVKINQIAVIITIESKVFQMIQSHMPPHHLLAHTVTLTSSTVNERENGSKGNL